MTIHMSQKWPEMVVEPDMCSHFYIESVYRIFGGTVDNFGNGYEKKNLQSLIVAQSCTLV